MRSPLDIVAHNVQKREHASIADLADGTLVPNGPSRVPEKLGRGAHPPHRH
jgi:hypothetical protein